MAKQPATPRTTEAAVEVIDEVVPMIAVDVRRGIEAMEMLEAANKPVTAALSGSNDDAIFGVGPVRNALALMVVLAMSRIFDIGGRSFEDQNKASLPLLAHYFARPDLKRALLSRHSPNALTRAEQQSALDDFDIAWVGHKADATLQDALRRLRLFRDHQVAHSLFGGDPGAPTYDELFRIVSRAADLAKLAERAGGHEPSFFDDFRDGRRGLSAAYWKAYIAGVKATAS